MPGPSWCSAPTCDISYDEAKRTMRWLAHQAPCRPVHAPAETASAVQGNRTHQLFCAATEQESPKRVWDGGSTAWTRPLESRIDLATPRIWPDSAVRRGAPVQMFCLSVKTGSAVLTLIETRKERGPASASKVVAREDENSVRIEGEAGGGVGRAFARSHLDERPAR